MGHCRTCGVITKRTRKSHNVKLIFILTSERLPPMGPPARLLPVAWRLLLMASGSKFLKKISWFAISVGDSELRFIFGLLHLFVYRGARPAGRALPLLLHVL